MEPERIITALKEELKVLLEKLNAEIVEFSLKRSGKKLILRLLVDKDGGITLDECALINRRIGSIIEEKSIIDEKYLLEVNSPGLDRPLKTKRDFKRVQRDDRVDFWLSEPIQDRNFLSARIKSVSDQDVIVVDKDENEISIPYQAINKAKISF